MEVLPFRCRPRPVAGVPCAGDTPTQRGDPKTIVLNRKWGTALAAADRGDDVEA